MTPGKAKMEAEVLESPAEQSRPRLQPIRLRTGSASDLMTPDRSYYSDDCKDLPMPETDGVNPLQIQQCCVVLEEVERNGKRPITLDWFRDEALLHSYKFDWLHSSEFRQQVIDKAVEAGAIRVSNVANSIEGQPCLATVERVNAELPNNGKRFNPIVVRGEPVSVSMMRDRGRY